MAQNQTPKPQDRSAQGDAAAGISWAAMLGLIAAAFAVAALIAYRLVAPFFHHA